MFLITLHEIKPLHNMWGCWGVIVSLASSRSFFLLISPGVALATANAIKSPLKTFKVSVGSFLDFLLSKDFLLLNTLLDSHARIVSHRSTVCFSPFKSRQQNLWCLRKFVTSKVCYVLLLKLQMTSNHNEWFLGSACIPAPLPATLALLEPAAAIASWSLVMMCPASNEPLHCWSPTSPLRIISVPSLLVWVHKVGTVHKIEVHEGNREVCLNKVHTSDGIGPFC